MAVEAVVLHHLQHQMRTLQGTDEMALAAVSAIVADEQRHHDEAALHEQAGAFWPIIFKPLVRAATESVIWLGMRLPPHADSGDSP